MSAMKSLFFSFVCISAFPISALASPEQDSQAIWRAACTANYGAAISPINRLISQFPGNAYLLSYRQRLIALASSPNSPPSPSCSSLSPIPAVPSSSVPTRSGASDEIPIFIPTYTGSDTPARSQINQSEFDRQVDQLLPRRR